MQAKKTLLAAQARRGHSEEACCTGGNQDWSSVAQHRKFDIVPLASARKSKGAHVIACLFAFSDEPEPRHWGLYTGPIPLPPGRSALRAKAIRIGYKTSTEAVGRFEVQ